MIKHFSLLNLTIFPLSHNWEILKRLRFDLSTRKILSMECDDELPTLPMIIMLLFLLSPNVALPPS